jgi:hypothetical protein
MIKFNELKSGEVTTRRAKLVLFPLIIIYVVDFFSSIVRWQLTGYSGFTSGSHEATGYLVVEHGHTIHVTAGEYWLGHIQIIILVVGLVAWFAARAYFFHTGDLRREKPAA